MSSVNTRMSTTTHGTNVFPANGNPSDCARLLQPPRLTNRPSLVARPPHLCGAHVAILPTPHIAPVRRCRAHHHKERKEGEKRPVHARPPTGANASTQPHAIPPTPTSAELGRRECKICQPYCLEERGRTHTNEGPSIDRGHRTIALLKPAPTIRASTKAPAQLHL